MEKENEVQFAEETSFEELKADYRGRLNTIINSKLTTKNIQTFMESSLSNVITLVNNISYEYASKNTINASTDTDIEDKAFVHFGLNVIYDENGNVSSSDFSISALLDAIEKKRKILDMVDDYIARPLTMIDSVHTPPDLKEGPESEGDGDMKPNEYRDRFKTVLYILVNDFKLDLLNITSTGGVNSPEMMRKKSYITIDVPELNRIIEVCDEVGNRTFVYNRKKVLEFRETTETLRAMTKKEKQAWLRKNPGSGISFVARENWRDNIAIYLAEDAKLVEQEASDDQKIPFMGEAIKSLHQVSRGEHDEYRNFWGDEGKHLGSLSAIANKLDLEHRALGRAISEVPGLYFLDNKLSDAAGNVIGKAYCLEEIGALPSVQKLIKSTQERKTRQSVAKEDNPENGDIAGFGRDDQGRYLSSLKKISNRLGVHPHTLEVAVSKIGEFHIKNKELLDASGNIISKVYCLEEIRELPVVQELINRANERRTRKSVAKEDNPENGDIAGFGQDDQKRHLGPINKIAAKLGIHPNKLTRIIKRNPSLFAGKDMFLDTGDKFIGTVYCLEEVQALLKNEKNFSADTK